MKKTIIAVTTALVAIAGTALGAEFQPLGAIGIGGAGVARQNGALTAYWNPAGGAFNDKSFSFMTGAEFGLRGNDGLTENVDRLSKLDFDSIKNFNNGAATPQTVGDTIKLISILSDIQKRNGNLAMTAAAPVGFAIKHFSFGLYGNMEGYVQPMPDTTNILPTQTSGGTTAVTATSFFNAATNNGLTPDPGPSGYFNAGQRSTMIGVFTSNGLSGAQAAQLVDVIESQVKTSGIPADTVTAASASILANAFASGSGATLDKNTSSVMTKALLYVEAPFAYGHPFNLGAYGVLGIGASVKVIRGTVYQNQVLLVNTPSGSNVKSGDLVKDLTKNQETSTNFGFDLGALWKYQDQLSVGIVAKNLNAPKFTAPTYQRPRTGDPTASDPVRGSDVTLDPQVRAGIAYDPLKWLTFAADLDLTENSAVVPSTTVKSRNLGGGLEIHPVSWFKLRVGAYKNLAISEVGPVATAGLSVGPFDLDGAFSTDTFKVDGNTIPQEIKLQLMCGFTF